MSAPAAHSPSGTAGGDTARRRRPSVPAVLITVVVVLTVVLMGGRALDSARTAHLDPENSRANGARAVAQVLDDRGVDLAVARGRAGLDAVEITDSTTVVVTNTVELGTSTLEHLDTWASGARLVYVDPTTSVLEHVGSPHLPRSVSVLGSVPAACDQYDGLSLAVTEGTALGPEGCFDSEHGALLTEPVDRVTLFGAGQVLENGRITDGDNAAVALRLLGGGDRLVWYVPTSTDLAADEVTGIGTLLPRWIGPALWLVLLAGVTLALWRGRRLGRLATEPLPVVVHAIETTVGRGRMLRRSRDRGHAATVLRTSAREQLADRLQVSAGDLRTLVDATAARTGRPPAEVADLIDPRSTAPTDDAALVRLGQQLTALTEEVRHP